MMSRPKNFNAILCKFGLSLSPPVQITRILARVSGANFPFSTDINRNDIIAGTTNITSTFASVIALIVTAGGRNDGAIASFAPSTNGRIIVTV